MLLSCADEAGFPNTPRIEIVSVSPTQVNEFEEAVHVILKYEDGDGDLGHPHPDSLTLKVWDDRLSSPDWYHVQPLAPEGSSINITGELDVALNGTFIIGAGNTETTRYTLSIKDRAGNWSNEVKTPLITINK